MNIRPDLLNNPKPLNPHSSLLAKRHSLPLCRKNKYDDELEEFWVDHRTAGKQGTYEKEGLKESTSAAGTTDSLDIAGMEGNLHSAWGQRGTGAAPLDAPNKNATCCIGLTVRVCSCVI